MGPLKNGQYEMRRVSTSTRLPNDTAASLKVGGPKKGLASFDSANPSLGMPKKFRSNTPLAFSSWKQATP